MSAVKGIFAMKPTTWKEILFVPLVIVIAVIILLISLFLIKKCEPKFSKIKDLTIYDLKK